MKKTIMLLSVIFICSSFTIVGAEEPKAQSEHATVESAEINPEEKVLSNIKTAKDGKEQLTREVQNLDKEKEAVEKEKVEIGAKSGTGKEVVIAGDVVTQEKIHALGQKEATLTAKELAIKQKIQTYEQTVALIERKVQMLGNKDISLIELRNEEKAVQSSLLKLEKKKIFLQKKIPVINLELKATQAEIAAQKSLASLKEGTNGEILETIKINEDELVFINSELFSVKERINFLDVQIELVRDYLSLLSTKRLDVLQRRLFAPAKPYTLGLGDGMFMLLLLLSLLSLFIVLKRMTRSCGKGDISGARRMLLKSMRMGLIGGGLFLLAYFCTAFLGYHQLSVYLGLRVFVVVVTILALFVAYRIVMLGVRKVFAAMKAASPEQPSSHPFIGVFATFFGWALFLLGIFIVAEISGVKQETISFILEAVQKPFFTLGKVSVSIAVIFKVVVILWVAIVGARLLDVVLKKNVYPKLHIDEDVQYTFSVSIKYSMVIVGIFIVLSVLGVDLAALTVFAGTLGIAIGLGLQDIAKNFISGIVMLIERPVKIGDYVEVGELPGRVKAIKARSTIVDTFDNISVIVPNSEFMTQRVVNWSYSDKITRVHVKVGVAYGSDVELVKACLLEVADKHLKVLRRPESYVWFEEFGDSSLNFKLYFWTNEPNNRFTIKSELHFSINRIFKEKGITIAFPQRDIHFRSSGVSLK